MHIDQSIKKKHTQIEKFVKEPINIDIFNYVELFIDAPAILTAALIQNPYGENQPLDQIEEEFGREVCSTLEVLNRLYSLDPKIIDEYFSLKPVIILFLINHRFFFTRRDQYPQAKELLTQERIAYAMQLLELLDVSEIRSDLEDEFFTFLEPEIYSHYSQLLKFTRDIYKHREEEIKSRISDLLEGSGITCEAQSRLKSIYSIHKKIIKKKILYSQILDTIGLRLIVDNEKECYQLMGLILKKWPIMSSKIKDYIAVPKANGYQSIHLTILDGEQPVEIQIRTRDMHQYAQYGLAAHHKYKSKK